VDSESGRRRLSCCRQSWRCDQRCREAGHWQRPQLGLERLQRPEQLAEAAVAGGGGWTPRGLWACALCDEGGITRDGMRMMVATWPSCLVRGMRQHDARIDCNRIGTPGFHVRTVVQVHPCACCAPAWQLPGRGGPATRGRRPGCESPPRGARAAPPRAGPATHRLHAYASSVTQQAPEYRLQLLGSWLCCPRRHMSAFLIHKRNHGDNSCSAHRVGQRGRASASGCAALRGFVPLFAFQPPNGGGRCALGRSATQPGTRPW